MKKVLAGSQLSSDDDVVSAVEHFLDPLQKIPLQEFLAELQIKNWNTAELELSATGSELKSTHKQEEKCQKHHMIVSWILRIKTNTL